MDSNQRLTVARSDQGLAVQGEWIDSILADETRSQAGWVATPMGGRRFLIEAPATGNEDGLSAGIGKCSVTVFGYMLFGLVERRWSGSVSVEDEWGQKKLYFRDGELVFARSNAMDHRLGEVMYRQGLISLDELTESAVQVTRTLKFGQVLLTRKFFEPGDLWDALKQQVVEILRSIFLSSNLFFELREDDKSASTNLVFLEGTRFLLDEAVGFGRVYRSFVSRLKEGAVLKKSKAAGSKAQHAPGSFFGDLLLMAEEDAQISSILERSKLQSVNTYVALMTLVNQGLCDIEGAQGPQARQGVPSVGPVRSRVDAYDFMLAAIKQAFVASKMEFPTNAIRQFVLGLNPKGFVTFFLDESGAIDSESLDAIYSECEENRSRVELYAARLESANQFLVQLALDLLPKEAGKDIAQNYAKIRS